MEKVVAFFGHRNLFAKDLRERLKNEVETIMCDEIHCVIGTHGEFDCLSLSVCRELRKSYPHIKITIVFTSLNAFKKGKDDFCSVADMYSDVETMIYDIEEEYFKNQIVVSNRKMVEESDLIICYVDMKKNKSGAKRAVDYAIKLDKKVINIFNEQDRPFYGMSKEEIEKERHEFFKK